MLVAQKQQLSLKPQVEQMDALPPLRSGIGEPQTGQGISSTASSRGAGVVAGRASAVGGAADVTSAATLLAGLVDWLGIGFLTSASHALMASFSHIPQVLYPSYSPREHIGSLLAKGEMGVV
jgi:hypothetical protein